MNLNTNIISSKTAFQLKTKSIQLKGNHKILYKNKIPQYIYEYEHPNFNIYRISPFIKIHSFELKNVIDFSFSNNGLIMAILIGNELILFNKSGIVYRMGDVYSSFEVFFCDLFEFEKNNNHNLIGKNNNHNLIERNNNPNLIGKNNDQNLIEKNNNPNLIEKEYMILKENQIINIFEIQDGLNFKLTKKQSKRIKNLYKNFNNQIEIKDKILKIKNRKLKRYSIKFGEKLSCCCSDILNSKIFAGSESGRIYVFSLVGDKIKILDFHKGEIQFLVLSFDEKILFSSDGQSFCVWDVYSNVLIESHNVNVMSVSSIHMIDIENSIDPIIPKGL